MVLCKTGAQTCLYTAGNMALTPSSHLVKLVSSLQFNSLLLAWLMWNPTEECDHMAFGVLEVERCH